MYVHTYAHPISSPCLLRLGYSISSGHHLARSSSLFELLIGLESDKLEGEPSIIGFWAILKKYYFLCHNHLCFFTYFCHVPFVYISFWLLFLFLLSDLSSVAPLFHAVKALVFKLKGGLACLARDLRTNS